MTQMNQKVYSYIEANPGTTTKALSSIVSSKKELAAILNELIITGCVIPQLNNRFTMQFFAVKAPAQVETVEVESAQETVEISAQTENTVVEPVLVTDADKEAFCVAFKKLEKSGKFVSIFNLRKALSSWSREKFDEVLDTLRGEKVQLHIADKCLMTEEECESTIIESDGHHMGTATWMAA